MINVEIEKAKACTNEHIHLFREPTSEHVTCGAISFQLLNYNSHEQLQSKVQNEDSKRLSEEIQILK